MGWISKQQMEQRAVAVVVSTKKINVISEDIDDEDLQIASLEVLLTCDHFLYAGDDVFTTARNTALNSASIEADAIDSWISSTSDSDAALSASGAQMMIFAASNLYILTLSLVDRYTSTHTLVFNKQVLGLNQIKGVPNPQLHH